MSALVVMLLSGCSEGGDDSEGSQRATRTTLPASRAEVDAAYAACLREAGFAAEAVDDAQGGVSIQAPPEQAEALEAAESDCDADLRERGLVADSSPPDEAELGERYEFVVALRDCLADKGYPTPEPPSVETYVSSSGSYTPYGQLPADLPEAEFNRLLTACPQFP